MCHFFFCTFARSNEKRTLQMDGLREFVPLPGQRKLYESVYDKVEREARRNVLHGRRPFRGSCHGIWAEMGRIFWEEYGIEWQSPAELNPHVRFD